MSARLLDERGRPTWGAWRVLAACVAVPFGVAFAVTVASADDEPLPASRPAPAATLVEEASGDGVAQPGRLRAAAQLPKAPPKPRPMRVQRRVAPAPVIVRAAPTPRPAVAAPAAPAPAPAPAPYVAPAAPAPAPAPAPQETFDSAGSFESEG